MKSKFKLLILEDAEDESKKIRDSFGKYLNENRYEVVLVDNIADLRKELENNYFLAISFDQKIPEKKDEPAEFFKTHILTELVEYHPLGMKAFYTAYPEWRISKGVARLGIEYYNKGEMTVEMYAKTFSDLLTSYREKGIYNQIVSKGLYPIAREVNGYRQPAAGQDATGHLKAAIVKAVILWNATIYSLLGKKPEAEAIKRLDSVDALYENLSDLKGLYRDRNELPAAAKEIFRVLDNAFIEDLMSILKSIETEQEIEKDLIVLLMLKLQFFVLNSIAIEVIPRISFLGTEIEYQKIANRAFPVGDYAAYFEVPPPKSDEVPHIVIKTDIHKYVFVSIKKYIKIDIENDIAIEPRSV